MGSGAVWQVRKMTVRLDGQLLSPVDGFLVRKGPGNCHFDFAQLIVFGQHVDSASRQRPGCPTQAG